jgi:hypothetical protein
MVYNGSAIQYGRGATMIKDKQHIIKDKTKKMSKIVQDYTNGIDKLSDTSEFTIDNIETMWSEANDKSRGVFKEISEEAIQQVDEREIIKSKKRSTKRKG